MRRIRDNRENETEENAREAYANFSDGKHKRASIREFDENLDENIRVVLDDIINETFFPKGYKNAHIFKKKHRTLAKAPIIDHVTEATAILPYEKQIYDYIAWWSPAVRPGLGTHALLRFIRNDLYRHSQDERAYYFAMDIHHYFPLMDHQVLKEKVENKFKKGKLRNLIMKVIDSYAHGIPLGVKIAQIFGMLELADFDRLLESFFGIPKDPEKMEYWTSRYITERCMTATWKDIEEIGKGSIFLAGLFRRYVNEGLKSKWRFVDNIIVIHHDKAFLRIVRELAIMHLTRDYHCSINPDYNIRPVWMGIRICGYTFYHDHVEVSKENKKNAAKRIARLKKKGFTEEQIRIKVASQLGYIKHADSINLFKKIGMENSIGKIIKKRKVRPPFEGMRPEQKVPFSSILNSSMGGGKITSIYLLDYQIMESKIEKTKVTVTIPDGEGVMQDITKVVPGKVLALRFRKIVKTFILDGEEKYVFEKVKDKDGMPTEKDAEFYTFSGSKVMIDQALNDFTTEDLPAPTVIQQFIGKDGKTYTKFT